MEYQAKDYQTLLGLDGLSERLLENHFKLYQGYVKNVNLLQVELRAMIESDRMMENPMYSELKRRFGWEWNGMMLHEYYFENLSKDKVEHNEESKLHKQFVADFGTHQIWEKDFKGVASLRGIGWAVLYYDLLGQKLINGWINEHDTGHLVGCLPILVMDVFEHAFMVDYDTKKPAYIDVFMNNIYWTEAERRFEVATLC
jgi:Fe-Mn family superoxide dismutase